MVIGQQRQKIQVLLLSHRVWKRHVIWLGAGWTVAQVIGVGVSCQAQDLRQALPPPPSVPSLPWEGQPAPPNAGSYQRETIFQAPASVQPGFPAPGSLPALIQYAVLVNGDSPYLLEQVQLIEPTAVVQDYQGRRLIQAGLFDNPINARERVAALGAQGIGSTVVSSQAGQPLASGSEMGVYNQVQAAPFLVVIPTEPVYFSVTTERLVQLGVRPETIQQRYVPRGPHLAIGPFALQGQAEDMTRQLREQGLDARVFYGR